ncbi:3-oxoacyl-ACP reductase FabG [uncultured Alistipes sp.]|jgi:3-oxoacyl-[acyl-carrier-protein] reductase|uniref:3-oxoacyl-ACP reductase FabG n=1 Tax=uncultured Alistipes sp. TaxID=538949 RepID=UPI0025FA6254|nr:3-oxoacyl-ACP reductase FabG [uncultured Alistipes sp.]
MKRYALVTGGSRGIGRAICEKLAAEGYHLLVNYRSDDAEAQRTLTAIEACGSTGELLKFDVADEAATRTVLETWQAAHPDAFVEVLVNNAGIRRDNLMMWMPSADWMQVIATSLGGFYHVTQPLLQPMLAKRRGRIVNIVSLSGLKGLPGQTNYSAAKGGVIAATKALAQEVAKRGVTVNAVAPGYIDTDMTADLDQAALRTQIPTGRFGKPEEVAELVAFLASDKAAYITGEVISINGGIY